MPRALKIKRKVVGLKQCVKAITEETVIKVYIAKDADRNVIERILNLYNQKEVETIYVNTKKELGELCDIEIGAAVACIIE